MTRSASGCELKGVVGWSSASSPGLSRDREKFEERRVRSTRGSSHEDVEGASFSGGELGINDDKRASSASEWNAEGLEGCRGSINSPFSGRKWWRSEEMRVRSAFTEG